MVAPGLYAVSFNCSQACQRALGRAVVLSFHMTCICHFYDLAKSAHVQQYEMCSVMLCAILQSEHTLGICRYEERLLLQKPVTIQAQQVCCSSAMDSLLLRYVDFTTRAPEQASDQMT